MFTGLVEACVPVGRVERRGTGLRAWIERPAEFEVALGQSIAVSGACLTVAGLAGPATGPGAACGEMMFDLTSETLARTWFAGLSAGTRVNLERALRLGDRLDGHLVAGHVDGRARITSVEDGRDGGRSLTFEVEPGLERYLVDKGSITLDGVSLTVVAPRGASFAVALVPLTLERTSLGRAERGAHVNVEVDLVGKWIERLAVAR